MGSKHEPLMRQSLVSANVAMTLVGHGCVMGISAILIPGLRAPESHIHANVTEESWIASAIGVPLVIGNALITILMDVLGRKKCHVLATLPVLVGWFMLLLVNDVTGLIAARLIQSVSLGFFGPLCPIIIAEMTDPTNRGMFLTCISLAITVGVLLSHALGTIVSWKLCALICSFTTFSSFLMLFYTPESPAWLITKGRYEEARDIYIWLRGNGEAQDQEFERMITGHKQNRNYDHTSKDLSFKKKVKSGFSYFNKALKKPEFYRPFTIMIFMYITYQFAGINVFSAYATDIIEQVVGTEVNAKAFMVILDIERLVCNILSLYLIKVVKRRTLLFSTGLGCILVYFGKASHVYLRENDMLPYDSQWIPISLIAVYMLTLTIGISSVPFAIAGEIFPLEYRGLGSGTSNFALSLNYFLVVKSFPVLNRFIGLPMTYVLFASVVIMSLSVIWIMLPETKDRILQDIENEFRRYSPVDVTSTEPLNQADCEVADTERS